MSEPGDITITLTMYQKGGGWQFKTPKSLDPSVEKTIVSSKGYPSINAAYDAILDVISKDKESIYMHVHFKYRKRRIEIYHNWRHELICSASEYRPNIHMSIQGDWDSLENAYLSATEWVDNDIEANKGRFWMDLRKLPRKVGNYLLYLMGALPLISVFVVVYWVFEKSSRDRFREQHEKIAVAIYLSAFITIVLVLTAGIERMLFFMPEDWGSFDEDGEFQPHRITIAAMLALAGVCFIAYLIGKVEERENEIQHLNQQIGAMKEKVQEIEAMEKEVEGQDADIQKLNDEILRLSQEIQILEEILEERE